MKIKFIDISPKEVEKNFPDFYCDKKVFFEIVKNGTPIGFFGIESISEDVGEISIYINESNRKGFTKGDVMECLFFPQVVGFRKILISTELAKMNRFLKKMSKIGVKYLSKKQDMYWFEVNYEH